MAILWVEGFEQYASSDASLQDAWVEADTAGTTTGRNTELTNNKALYFSYYVDDALKQVPTSTDTVVLGLALRTSRSIGVVNQEHFIRLQNSSRGTHVELQLTDGGVWRFLGPTGSELCNAAGYATPTNTWIYMELVVTLHDTTGSVELFVDGDSKCSATGVDTLNGSIAAVEFIHFYSFVSTSHNVRLDDIYFLDDSGTDNTARLGSVVIETQFPNANGNTNDFTASPAVSNYLNVDDGGAPDSGTTYNYSSTASDKELYGFPDLETSYIGTIKAVGVTNHIQKGGTGYRTIRALARSSATEGEGSTVPLTTDWYYQTEIFENDPNGGIDWTESSVNAAEFGVKIQD